jgi:integrase
MAELLDCWYGVSYVNWAPTTARSVRSIIDQQLVLGFGEVLVRELTAVTIDELYARLRVSCRTDGKALSVGSVRRVHAVLHRALAQAVRWEWIWANPAALASPPRSEPVEMRPPTPADVAALLAYTHEADPLLRLFVVLAATMGARRGQLLALRWMDIDVDTKSISFQRALVEGPGGPVLVPTKTRRSHRVALDPGTAALLAAWFDGIAHAQAEVRDRFIFCYDEAGTRPWKPNYVTKRFIQLRKAAGLSHFRLHDLRHFMATQMLDVGVAVPIVAARLAHARASTTLNVYAHAVPGSNRHAAQPLSRRLAEVISASPAKLKVRSAQSDVGAAR